MYNAFFGFGEKPFQLVPNPAYLFLSKAHEEALAHLSYAVSQGDGFVEITGEVGTGKTTLCRAFLESPAPDTEVAYVFNPLPDPVQLLKTINEEFGIPADSDNRKDLIDILNAFLMKKKSEGKKTILLIDEAQNLSKDVLEQLRLLSNLETTTSKLLQIILVGQPELRDMLDSRELRQLAQRITLSCHLTPLNFGETRDYVRHRIQVASKKPGTRFTDWAIRAIWKYSSGIPRLINIACDRALLVAFGLNQRKITRSIAKAAIRELSGRADRFRASHSSFLTAHSVILCLSLIVLCLALFQAYRTFAPVSGSDIQEAKKPVAIVKEPPPKSLVHQETDRKNETSPKNEPLIRTVSDFGELLKNTDIRESRNKAIRIVTHMWEGKPVTEEFLADISDNETFFRTAAAQNGLSAYRFEGNLNRLISLNLPVILELYLPLNPSPAYIALVGTKNDELFFRTGESDALLKIAPTQLEGFWAGAAVVVWKNFLGITGTIPRDSPPESVITLKTMLRDMGHPIEILPGYEERTRKIVEDIQRKHGLKPDGSVGPMTKIVLYNEMKYPKIPHILSSM